MTQSQQIAAGITFIITVILLLWLLLCHLSWNPALDTPEPDPYIALIEEEEFLDVEVLQPTAVGEEDVAPTQNDEDAYTESQPAPLSGVDASTQGKVDNPVQTVTQQKPSTVTEKPKPSTSKPAATIENKKEDEEKAMAKQTQNTVSNAFANAQNKNNSTNGLKDEGKAGKADGNPDSGAGPNANGTKVGSAKGTVGGGWRIPAYSRNIPSNEIGSVKFEVAVKSDGSIEKITQISNNGLTAATISRCRAEIQKHKFKNQNPSTAQAATAIITFTFQDPAN